MTSTPAFSAFTALLPSPANARALSPDGRGAGGQAWQRALDGAATGSAPASGRAAEAGYLMTLANLGALPSAGVLQVLSASPPVPVTPAATDGAPQVGVPTPVAQARTLQSPAAAHAPVAVRPQAAKPRPDTTVVVPTPADEGAEVSPAVTARQANLARASKATGRSASASHESASVPPTAHDVVAPVAVRASATQAIAGYVQAASGVAAAGATAANEPGASFVLTTSASSVPVRVHVQWRGRVADVWIGLQRRAFDQLPDIRSGIEDWVDSRGGAIGRLVCNGETLTGDPSFPFTPGVL